MDSPDHGHDVREQPSLPSLAPRRDGAVAPRHVSATAAAPQVATRPAAPPATKPLLARRRKVVAACDTCRNRKAKCDGTRPRCRTCIDHGRRCEFFTEPDESRQAATRRHQARSAEQLHQLQTDHDALQDFVHDLVSQPDPAEVQRILAQFCHGSRPAYVPQASPGLLAGVCSSHGLQEHGTQDGLAANASAAAAAPLRGLGRPPRAPLAPALPPRRRTSSTASKRKRSASPPPYKKLFDLLVKSSPDDAMSIFQRARRTGDVVTVLSQAKEADLLLQLHVVPETRRRYDLPLRSDMPDFLLTADNPYLDTPIHDSYFARPPATTSPSASLNARHVGFGNNNNNNNNNKIHHVTPFGSAELHEPTLDDIKPSAWTTVLDEDLVLRRLLRSYFLYDYQNYPAFHKDLFLQDMKRGRRRFCSPLLVNAVLAAAAHADSGVPNSDKFWLPQGLAYRFLAEAKRLWDMEDHGIIKLTTMQAAIILNAISLTDTTDKIGMAFLRQAVDMAEGMKLMTTRDDEISSRSMRKARAVTAWCLFSWDVIQSFFFFKKPMFKSPPLHALPETNHQEWYGEIWLRYPGDQNQLTPAYAGAVFSASMGLRKIQHAISVAFFERPKGDPRPSAQDVAKFFGYTYRWFDALPENISPKNTVLPTHLRLHMEYYTALITLARVQPASIASSGEPLEQKRSEFADPSESHLPAPESAVKDPMAHALVCLETLVRIYQMRHGITFYDSSMCYYLAFMGACIIQALGEYYTALAASASPASGDVSSIDLPSRARLEAYRSTLIMCAKGLHELGKSAYVCQVTYYILRDTMSARERTIILSHLKEYSAAASHASSGADDSNESDSGDGEVEGEQSFNEGDSSDQQSGPGPPGSKKVRVKREEEDTIEMRIRKYNQSQFPMPTISIVEDPKNHTLTELAVRYRRMSSGECSETGKSDDEDAGGESPMSD